jgi:hypothetical protein
VLWSPCQWAAPIAICSVSIGLHWIILQ